MLWIVRREMKNRSIRHLHIAVWVCAYDRGTRLSALIMSDVVSQLQLIQDQWSVGQFDRFRQLNIHTETTAGGMTTWCNQ